MFLVAVVGCQAIAKLETRTFDPPPGADGIACGLPGVGLKPSTGNGRVRLVNVGTQGGNVDVCIRKSGSSDWGRPVLREGGTDSFCTGGLAYTQGTIPFSVPVGKLDVKFIPAGKTCAEPATSEQDGIVIADSVTGGAPPTTLVRYAGGSSKEAVAALPEEPGAQDEQRDKIRVVNALSGGKGLVLGVTAAPSLPTTVSQVLFNVPSGTVAPSGPTAFGQIDAQGYLGVLKTQVTLGAAFADDATAKALLVAQTSQVTADTASLFVFGDTADNTHPVRGLVCHDFVTGQTDGGAGVGSVPSADYGLLANCSLTKLPTITVDTWDVGLYGPNSPYQSDRRPAVISAIAARQADLFCIVEADDKALDRDAIIAAGKTSSGGLPAPYPYSYEFDATPTTPADDPTTATGQQPPALANPPCGGSVNGGSVQAAYTCLEQNCSTVTNDTTGAGLLNGSTNCISNHCLTAFSRLYSPSTATASEVANDSCFNCILLHVTSGLETFAAGQSACTQQVASPVTFGGQIPIVILSHYPIVDGSQKAYVFPSYGFHRGILKAQIQLEDQQIDFFCNMVMSPQIDASLPYVGPYGQDGTLSDGAVENGWQDQQDLQAQRGVAWMKKEADADKLPAIITGNWYSTLPAGAGGDGGAGDDGGGASGLDPISPEVMSYVDNSVSSSAPFTRAEPPGYVRTCDACPENEYRAGGTRFEFTPVFLYGFPANAATSEVIWGTDNNAVTLVGSANEPPPTSGKGPLSEYYAHETLVLRPK